MCRACSLFCFLTIVEALATRGETEASGGAEAEWTEKEAATRKRAKGSVVGVGDEKTLTHFRQDMDPELQRSRRCEASGIFYHTEGLE